MLLCTGDSKIGIAQRHCNHFLCVSRWSRCAQKWECSIEALSRSRQAITNPLHECSFHQYAEPVIRIRTLSDNLGKFDILCP